MKEWILILAVVVSVILIVKAIGWLSQMSVSRTKRFWLTVLVLFYPPIGALIVWLLRKPPVTT